MNQPLGWFDFNASVLSWYHSESLDVLYSLHQFLGWDSFFAVSYSKPDLFSNQFVALEFGTTKNLLFSKFSFFTKFGGNLIKIS